MKKNDSSSNTVGLKGHFWALSVTLLVLVGGTSQPSVAMGKALLPTKAELRLCLLNLMGGPKEATEARTRYALIAREARTNGARQPETFDYIQKNLDKLVAAVKAKSDSLGTSRAQNPRMKKAIETFFRLAKIYDRERPRRMEDYLRLAYLGAQTLDLMTTPLSAIFRTHDYYAFHRKQGPSDPTYISLLESDDTTLMNWIMHLSKNTLLIGLSPSFNSSVGELTPGWVYIPSFANFGFRTLLWSLSRGIGFVGQVSVRTQVDGADFGPSEFMAHDYAHLGPLTFNAYDPASMKVWDFFEERLDQSGLTGLELKLAEGLLFMIFHEELTYPLTCASIKTSEIAIRNRLDDRAEDGYYFERFNDLKDFGQVFPGGVTPEQIKRSAALVGRWVAQVCR